MQRTETWCTVWFSTEVGKDETVRRNSNGRGDLEHVESVQPRAEAEKSREAKDGVV